MLLYLGPPPADWGDVAVDSAVLGRYVGTYRGEDGGETFFVRLEDEGFLTLQSPDRARERLYARSDTTFYTLKRPLTTIFRTSGAEEGPTTIEVRQDERSRNAEPTTSIGLRSSEDTPAAATVAGFVASGTTEFPARRRLGRLGWLLLLGSGAAVALAWARRAV